MKCDDVFEAILAVGPLTDDMRDHIETCVACSALRKSVEALDAAGEAGRERDVSPSTVHRVLAEAARLTEERMSPPHMKMKEWWFIQRLTAAALLVLAVGLGVMLFTRLKDSADPDTVASVSALAVGTEADSVRVEVAGELSGFMARHYPAQETSALDAEFRSLRSRMAVISVGLEKEFAGLKKM